MRQDRQKRIESARSDGDDGKLVRTNLFLSKSQSMKLDLLALQQDRPKGRLLHDAVAEYLERNQLRPEEIQSLVDQLQQRR